MTVTSNPERGGNSMSEEPVIATHISELPLDEDPPKDGDDQDAKLKVPPGSGWIDANFPKDER